MAVNTTAARANDAGRKRAGSSQPVEKAHHKTMDKFFRVCSAQTLFIAAAIHHPGLQPLCGRSQREVPGAGGITTRHHGIHQYLTLVQET
jgi:hypothetical protein